jgi:pappalysin-1
LDGVVIDPIALPGGNPEYGLGITAVHEVGHWLSLFHTFESHGNETKMAGCYGDGDFLEDTPAEASPAFGCQKVRNPPMSRLSNLK